MHLRDFKIGDEALLEKLNKRQSVHDFLGRVTMRVDLPGRIQIIEIDGEGVGVVGVVKSGHTGPDAVELICALLKSAEGKRFASQACQLFLEEYRIQEEVRCIACVSPSNPAARRLALKLGFVETPERRNLEVVYVQISA